MICETDSLLKTLNRQFKEMDALYYRIASMFNLSESAFWILYTISKSSQECTQQDISTELSISKQTVNSAIQSLIKKGYIFLDCKTASSRRKNVRMTEKGVRFVSQYIKPLQKAEIEAFLKMNIEERENYAALSQMYLFNLRQETEKLLQLHKNKNQTSDIKNDI